MQKISLFFCLWCFGICQSQNTISGKITGEDNVAIEKCHIHIGSKSVNSDKNGFYSLQNIPKGSVKFLITYIGYRSIDTTITVNGNSEIDFVMKTKKFMNKFNQFLTYEKPSI